MKLKNNSDWIRIDFLQCASTSEYLRSTLKNIENCIEIILDFEIEEVGWGMVGDEYFTTLDIRNISAGLNNIYNGKSHHFNYSADFPYECSYELFYTINVSRVKNKVDVELVIFDGLNDYIKINEKMELLQFHEIVKEFEEVTKRCPVV